MCTQNPTMEEYMEVVSAGERNTWPSIPRIRAHCLVEITLDKCVQRLRRRISTEAMSGSFTGLNRSGVPVVKASKMDRTPSFYTSRSILNLSGDCVLVRMHLKR